MRDGKRFGARRASQKNVRGRKKRKRRREWLKKRGTCLVCKKKTDWLHARPNSFGGKPPLGKGGGAELVPPKTIPLTERLQKNTRNQSLGLGTTCPRKMASGKGRYNPSIGGLTGESLNKEGKGQP